METHVLSQTYPGWTPLTNAPATNPANQINPANNPITPGQNTAQNVPNLSPLPLDFNRSPEMVPAIQEPVQPADVAIGAYKFDGNRVLVYVDTLNKDLAYDVTEVKRLAYGFRFQINLANAGIEIYQPLMVLGAKGSPEAAEELKLRPTKLVGNPVFRISFLLTPVF